MNITLKRRLTYGTILLFNLCAGLGYAIIFPTIWNYIHERLGGDTAMLGVVISAYSLSSFFANPLVGWWSDRSLNTRAILLVTILAEIVGNVLYFVGIHLWVLVVGRIIAGLGAGGGAAVLADITRTTTEEDRTSVLSVVIASRQLGLLVGPGLNIFLSKTDFELFSLPVDKFTSPGLFMAVVWVIVELVVLFTYTNLTNLKDDEDVEKLFQNYNSIITGSIPYSDMDNLSTLEVAFTSSYPPYGSMGTTPQPSMAGSSSQPNLQVEWLEEDVNFLKREEIESINCQQMITDVPVLPRKSPIRRIRNAEERAGSVSDHMIESAERVIQSMSGSYGTCVIGNSIGQEKREVSSSSAVPSTHYSSQLISYAEDNSSLYDFIKREILRDEIVVLLGLAFVSSFAQTVLETVVTPLAQKYYSFTEMDNSYIYLFAGIEVIIVFVAIKYLSKRVSDRILILFGLVSLAFATISPIIFIPSSIPGHTNTLVYFIITIIVDLIGIATIVVCSSSLLSKLTSENSQALFQGFRRSMMSLGCIVGPLWGGSYLFNIYLLFGIPLAVTSLIVVLFLISYKKLDFERL